MATGARAHGREAPWAHFGHTWAQTKAISANHIECYFAAHSRFDALTWGTLRVRLPPPAPGQQGFYGLFAHILPTLRSSVVGMAQVVGYQTTAGKRYRVRYRTPDRRQTDKRGFRTKREAERKP
jgi:hypothetical protein